MVVLDFETYSSYDLDAGVIKYLYDNAADIICMAYKIDDGPIILWLPGEPRPDFSGHDIYAHSASFDYLVWHILGTRYGFVPIPLSQWHDTMALANRYSYPSELDKVTKVLGLKAKKNPKGKALIKKICKPTIYGDKPQVGMDFTYDDLHNFYDYCKDDVSATSELIKNLPSSKLSDEERKIWDLTFEMNMNGLPIDEELVHAILDQTEIYTEEMMKLVPEFTNGQVQKVTQIEKLKQYINKHSNLSLPDLTAETVDKALLNPDVNDTCFQLLKLRQLLGSSSIKKYKKIRAQVFEGRIFFNLHYYGAGPGRWAGRGFQMHNLPRKKVDDPEYYIEKFKNHELVDKPIATAKALIRPTICAAPGYVLLCSDYKSIENVLLLFVAEDYQALKLFEEGLCQYTDMAAYLYNKPYDSITKAERQVGKVIILGCGYNMGAARLEATCNQWGIFLEAHEYLLAIQAYRAKYPLVKELWYALKNCAVAAIRHPGMVYSTNKVTFKVVKDRSGRLYLSMTLPSGRNIYYADPFLEDDAYGATPCHFGTNPYSKKWGKLRLIPGRITENVVQGSARDIMANGLLEVKRNMPDVRILGTVHDEGIGEIKTNLLKEDTLEQFNTNLCALPLWAQGLPLKADGWVGKRYRKE